MPKESMDYSKCIIYKIQHINNDELLYVGHTTNFNKRKYNHKSSVNNEKGNLYNLKLYQMIRENGGWDNFNMIVIKEFPCQNLREAEAEEDKVMREMKATMNMIRAFHPKEERCEDNKEKLQEYHREYREKNKEKIQEYFSEYIREYNEKNKEKIQERKSRVCLCPCGKTYTHSHKLRHEKSKFHKIFLNPCINTDPFVSLQPELVAS